MPSLTALIAPAVVVGVVVVAVAAVVVAFVVGAVAPAAVPTVAVAAFAAAFAAGCRQRTSIDDKSAKSSLLSMGSSGLPLAASILDC